MEPAVAVQRFTDNFEDTGNDLGRQQRLAGGDDAYLAGPLLLQAGSALRAEIRASVVFSNSSKLTMFLFSIYYITIHQKTCHLV